MVSSNLNLLDLITRHAPTKRKSRDGVGDPTSNQMRAKMVQVNGYTVAPYWRKRPSSK